MTQRVTRPTTQARNGMGIPPPTRQRTLGEAAVVLAVVSWGFVGVLIKVSHFPGIVFGFYRLWFAFLVMAVAMAVTRRPLTMANLRRSAPAGVLFGVDVACFFTAVKLTSVADATIIGALQPALVLVVAGPWFGERVGVREVALTALSIGGVALVAIGSSGTPAWSLAGDLLAACALLSWTGYWLVTKHARSRSPISALEYMTGVMLTAALVITPVVLLSGERLSAPRPIDWLWLWIFVLIPASGGQLLVAWAQRYVEVWLSSLLSQAMPLIAAVSALVVLGERIAPLEIVGGLIVIAATGSIVILDRMRQAKRDAEAGTVALLPAPPG